MTARYFKQRCHTAWRTWKRIEFENTLKIKKFQNFSQNSRKINEFKIIGLVLI